MRAPRSCRGLSPLPIAFGGQGELGEKCRSGPRLAWAEHRADGVGPGELIGLRGRYAFNDAWYYTGSLSRWKASPRERLAESVVNCRYGRPNHTGMSLVPRYRCTAFLNQYKAALSVAR